MVIGLQPSPVLAAELQPVVWTKEALVQLVDDDATKYLVNANHARAIISCESDWVTDIVSSTNDYGLSQINRTAHPDISIQEADDPVFAADYLTSNMAAGRASMWNCWFQLRTRYGDGIWPE